MEKDVDLTQADAPFAFGRNWASYAVGITQEEIEEAQAVRVYTVSRPFVWVRVRWWRWISTPIRWVRRGRFCLGSCRTAHGGSKKRACLTSNLRTWTFLTSFIPGAYCTILVTWPGLCAGRR